MVLVVIICERRTKRSSVSQWPSCFLYWVKNKTKERDDFVHRLTFRLLAAILQRAAGREKKKMVGNADHSFCGNFRQGQVQNLIIANFSVLARKGSKLIANYKYSATKVTSLPSLSHSLSLSLSLSLSFTLAPHAQYRKRFRANY